MQLKHFFVNDLDSRKSQLNIHSDVHDLFTEVASTAATEAIAMSEGLGLSNRFGCNNVQADQYLIFLDILQ
jgi:hypothetical protein